MANIDVIDKNNKIKLLGTGICESEGIANGKVQDLKLLSDAILSSITTAEKAAEKTAQNLYVAISGPYLTFRTSQGTIPVTSGQGPSEIEQIHIDQVINNLLLDIKRHFSADKYEIIHCIPQYYTIDGQENIANPIGMIGYALSVKALIIIAETAPLRNIRKSIEMAGFRNATYVFSPIATAKAIMNKDEKELGALMIDIGGNISDLLMISNRYPRLAISIDKGSKLITYDLYTQLKTPPAFAEQLKIEYGDCFPQEVSPEINVNIDGIGGRQAGVVPLDYINQIIEERTKDILDEVYKQYLNNYQETNSLTAGIVLTGGASKMKNIDALCFNIFNMPVRIAYPDFSRFNEPIQQLNSPSFSTLVGLIYYALQEEAENKKSNRISFSLNFSSIKNTITNIFKEFL